MADYLTGQGMVHPGTAGRPSEPGSRASSLAAECQQFLFGWETRLAPSERRGT